MTPKATCGLAGLMAAMVAGAPPSAAADPLAVRVTGSVPFTSGELESALALRAQLATPEAAQKVVASVDGDGPRVRIAVTGRERVMDLDAEDGVDAARLVAFAILDLAGDQLDPPARRDAVLQTRVAALEPPANDREDPLAHVDDGGAQRRPARPHLPRWSAAVWAIAGTRTELVAEIGVPVRGSVRAIASAGYARPATLGTGSATVELAAVPVRLGLAWRGPATRVGGIEARLTAIGVIERAAGDRSATDAIVGGGAAVVWAMPFAIGGDRRGVTVLVGGGVDGFATARDYRLDGTHVATTERVAWWAGLAVSAELWR